jgi:ferric-dicitrate binding protein FerR (iron transport regulator)
VVQKHRDKLYRYYRDKHFECDNTPLWKVVEVLNEAYGDSVRIDNKALRTLTITTRFDEQELENILDIIAETFEIKVEKEGGIYHLK